MSDGVSNEPVIAPLPTPISVEPRTAAPAAEIARQAEEAKVAPADSKKAAEPAPKGDEPKKPISTREALRNAAAKVNAEPVVEKATPLKNDPKTAEPAAKVDAKAAEPASKTVPDRGEDGKFTAKVAEPASKADAQAPKVDESGKAAAVTAKAPDSVVKAPALPSHTAEPPPARFSAAAKERWAEAPDEVRAEVTRAVTELTKGFEKHREAAARDADIAEFHEMAAKGGTTVKQALSNYVNMENVLRADAIKGFELICQNAGLSLRDLASKILNQTPEQSASKADATILALQNKIAELEKGVGVIHQEREQQKTASTTETVAKFAADHPRFEELAEDIAFFLKTRTKDLAEAYSFAERLNPAPAAAAKAEEPAPTLSVVASSAAPLAVSAPAHTDRGEKSITGAPSAGSNPGRKQPSVSVKEAILRAAAAAR